MTNLTTHGLGAMHAMHLAQVVDNADPDSRGRIKIKMVATDVEIWANVVVASAGTGYGVSCIPKVDETVVAAFITPDQPLVIGSIWAGESSAPEEAEAVEDKYLIKTPSGLVVEMDDANGKIELRNESNYSITIDENAAEITVVQGGQKITLDSSQVKINGTKIVLEASTIEMNAGQISASAAVSNFSGIVQCDTMISNAVVGTSYTPGAGNIW